jgi:predicted nuclease of restriction endonuclease-like RecB superfamily
LLSTSAKNPDILISHSKQEKVIVLKGFVTSEAERNKLEAVTKAMAPSYVIKNDLEIIR